MYFRGIRLQFIENSQFLTVIQFKFQEAKKATMEHEKSPKFLSLPWKRATVY